MPLAVPTLEDVARAAGVSRSTASRAINGGTRVSPEAQHAVEQAVAELGYTPNPAARALATNQTGSIALVIPEPDELFTTDPTLLGLLRGVSHALAPHDLQLVLLLAHDGTRRLTSYLRAGHVDGAIVASRHLGDHLERELVGHTPVVFIGRPFNPEAVTWVDVDNVDGARQATQLLIDAGRRRIGTVTGSLDMTAGIDRLTGWRLALEHSGLATDAVAEGTFTIDSGERATARLLQEHPDLDAIFVASDLIGVGAYRVLLASGRRIPQDVAVVGFDALGAGSGLSPALTSMVNPVSELAQTASRLLLRHLADPGLPSRQVLLPSQPMLGGSV